MFHDEQREAAAFARWFRGETAGACERVPFAGYERSRERADRAAFEETLGAA